MNFLTRFLKVFIFALVLSAVGALIFYWLVMSGKTLQPGTSRDEFIQTVYKAVAIWGGFITLTSLVLTVTGMKQAFSVRVHDRNAFLQRVYPAITSLRYRPAGQSDQLLIFKPPGMAFLAEKITVQMGPDTATITAPRALLGKIQERL